MNTYLLPTYEEYNQKVVKLFINNCLLDISKEKKKEYAQNKECQKIIERCYRGDKYELENFEGFENVFSDYSILSRTCRTLETLYYNSREKSLLLFCLII